MSSISEILQLSATELRRLLKKQEVSPTEVVEACLGQIDEYNGTLNAMVTLNEKAADDARELEKLSPEARETKLLYGLPVGIKDSTPVAGVRTTFGSRLYANYIPPEDALVVRRLRRAGAIVLGKTNCPEFAAGGNTFNEVFGATRNPWNPKLTAGGSTGGGAAAVAAGMIALAEGTDLGGSLRIPASFCGVAGLRPSLGLIPTFPSDYLWDSLNVTGPIARDVEDIGLFVQAVAGPNMLLPISQPIEGRDFIEAVRVGIPKGARLAYCKDISKIGVDEAVENICLYAASEMTQIGADVDEIEMDLSFARKAFTDLRGYWFVAHHRQRLDQMDELSPNVAGNLRAGLKVTAKELAAAEQVRTELRKIFYKLFQKYDCLLTPCLPIPPFPVEQNYPDTVAGNKMETYVDWFASTFVLSLTSLPVASVPCGLDPNGLPVGLQIVGKPFGEETVLALSKQVQEAYPIGLPPLSELRTKDL